MATSLVIVESPAKANTLKKYLGKNFKVSASVGHIKDLPKSTLGVDIEHDFKPEYEIIKGKKKVVDELKKLAASSDVIYLAPDPDREGEAIAWHIFEDIKGKNKNVHRVLFNEITKKAVLAAIEKPQKLDLDKYHAQQARRILDRLVGYKISPLLWDKVRRGLSAGRVQSVALRIVVDREREIEKFKSEEYWTLLATFLKDAKTFEAKLSQVDGKKPEISAEAQATDIVSDLEGSAYQVKEIVKKERRKNPVPPFITAKLQQDAARKLGFTTQKTMMLAQKLYEGIELGEGESQGLITYMRTDSTRVSDEAIAEVRRYIQQKYGADYLPPTPHVYKSGKQAQQAHEAIRPTSLEFTPDRVKSYLDRDLFRLYELIWNRFLACQMKPAVFDQTTVIIDAAGQKRQYQFKAHGNILKFPGFLAVYQQDQEETQKGKEDDNGADDVQDQDRLLPELAEKETLNFEKLTPYQHFTEPPPRYSEASLVKALEENGIGRPSTYASIMGAIQNRDYVVKQEGRFFPTDLGKLVADLLIESFPKIMDIAFTAGMEEKLDEVEEGKVNWVEMLKTFYAPFEKNLKLAKKEMRNVKGEETKTDYTCEKCNAPMVIKWGRHGKFLACSAYPECKNTKEISISQDGGVTVQPKETTDEKCENCQSPMAVKQGRFGKFLACSAYPECKTTKPFHIGIGCPQPECGGNLVEKRTRSKKIFYGCSKYPNCQFATWYKPIQKPCTQCGAPFLVLKITKSRGQEYVCIRPNCEYVEAIAQAS
ncbi:MAG: type I DNA topoisomerase [Deltaproteobacteria bacterium]|nr:type I DNA topoisomerase [Deltaproteobacteria bacterium]